MIFSSVHPYDDARIFHKQAVSLSRAGYEVELHAVADFHEKVEQGVRIIGLIPRRGKLNRLRRGWECYKRAIRSQADIFHFHDPELLPWGALIRKRTGKPVIYDAHEDLPKQIHTKPYIPDYLKGIVSKTVRFVEKRLAVQLTGVITATDPIAEQFQAGKAARVQVIKNYPLSLPITEHPLPERNQIVYVGGISYLRGYREMIQMMDYLPSELQAELHLIGPLQHIAEADRDIERLQQKNVHIHGRIPFEAVRQWLLEAKVGMVCLHPVENYRESLPIKLFEYMSAGLPLVATDFPLWQKIVEDSNCGYVVDALNPQAMAEKVAHLLRDTATWQAQSTSGIEAFQTRYNWGVEEEKLLRFYHAIKR